MEVIYINIKDIKPYEKNPRQIGQDAIDKVANSIKEFGFQQPLVLDDNNVIVVGHTRYLAAKKLGFKDVPCVIAYDLSEEQIKAYRLADNKTGELSAWDFDLLEQELEELNELNMSDFGFEKLVDQIEEEAEEDKYTMKIDVPQYQITGAEPSIEELVDIEKFQSLIDEIENSNVLEEQKKFLKMAACRHLAFNYKNIAEYYAHQDVEMQDLMEKSALVIIDIDDAMKYGYVEMSTRLKEIIEDDFEG